MRRIWIKACPKCGGTLFEDRFPPSISAEVTCLQCGFWATGNPDENYWKKYQKKRITEHVESRGTSHSIDQKRVESRMKSYVNR